MKFPQVCVTRIACYARRLEKRQTHPNKSPAAPVCKVGKNCMLLHRKKPLCAPLSSLSRAVTSSGNFRRQGRVFLYRMVHFPVLLFSSSTSLVLFFSPRSAEPRPRLS
ncbi:hypothetical protein TGRH88_058500 [Toxoplasma gondii]|uniref:Transmembrane protein n=1 Tax=Toxoplasma gondii TaxID=5811 RepID=A0A7J6JV61_TOXGO|nr:hypothetical protein TGRH88_058500 [Toxoplasma gondii]